MKVHLTLEDLSDRHGNLIPFTVTMEDGQVVYLNETVGEDYSNEGVRKPSVDIPRGAEWDGNALVLRGHKDEMHALGVGFRNLIERLDASLAQAVRDRAFLRAVGRM